MMMIRDSDLNSRSAEPEIAIVPPAAALIASAGPGSGRAHQREDIWDHFRVGLRRLSLLQVRHLPSGARWATARTRRSWMLPSASADLRVVAYTAASGSCKPCMPPSVRVFLLTPFFYRALGWQKRVRPTPSIGSRPPSPIFNRSTQLACFFPANERLSQGEALNRGQRLSAR